MGDDTWITCPRCNGKPGDFDDPRYGCNRCHGGGKVRASKAVEHYVSAAAQVARLKESHE
jgi:DnaJ-class molecular chaperone